MPAFLSRRQLNPSSVVADAGGLMGPLSLPGAVIGGVLGKAAKLSQADRDLLNDLLGKPFRVGKRLLRLSSGDPAKNTGIVHTSEGERLATPLDDLLNVFRSHGEETGELFPEGAVFAQPGTRASGGQVGPKGGVKPMKRSIPKGATR